MRRIAILLIEGYQRFFSSVIRQIVGVSHACRFDPTCSEYAKISVSKKGLLVGGYLSLIRIMKCQPFYKGAQA
ncbi:MAG TPA: membrane protein insertion efficiency factor YidD [Patescibacteria group bacterium]|nr:membrane protein insertion efficiency factor YidD [Patescibacteria group bacterium]